MDLLLDTHTLIWMALSPDKLSAQGRKAIEDPTNRLLVSIASLWEMALKESKKQLAVPKGVVEFYKTSQRKFDVQTLSIEPSHLMPLKKLPHHHTDPFDRLIVCQAQVEGLTVITKDSYIPKYRVPVLW